MAKNNEEKCVKNASGAVWLLAMMIINEAHVP